MPVAHASSVTLNLALQGGGAHGAFTWGVLDALLDRPDIEIGRVSGKPGLGVWDDALPLLSPYQTNPVGLAPLRRVLDAVVDIEALRTPSNSPLFVNAVNVHSGLSRVFGPAEMSMDAILASACAPLMFQAVQIEGDSYWDGSYAGNPMLWPLYQLALDTDILMVELTPLHRPETPTTAKNILNRINEIASINGLLGEFRAMETINRSVPDADIRVHVLSLPDAGTDLELEPSIKRTVGPALFESLRRRGRAACEVWLEDHRHQLGRQSTVDIAGRYLTPYAQPQVPA